MGQAFLGAHVLGPQIGLQAQNMIADLLVQLGPERIERVEVFQRDHPAPAGRFGRQGGLAIVQIVMRVRRDDRIKTGLGGRLGAFQPSPGHDCRIG